MYYLNCSLRISSLLKRKPHIWFSTTQKEANWPIGSSLVPVEKSHFLFLFSLLFPCNLFSCTRAHQLCLDAFCNQHRTDEQFTTEMQETAHDGIWSKTQTARGSLQVEQYPWRQKDGRHFGFRSCLRTLHWPINHPAHLWDLRRLEHLEESQIKEENANFTQSAPVAKIASWYQRLNKCAKPCSIFPG